MHKLLFFHGGPGLNSHAEEKTLTQLYKDNGLELHCWNEPSVLRNSLSDSNHRTRHEQLLDSAASFLEAHYSGTSVTLVGHSMGAQTVTWLAQQYPEKVQQIAFIGGCFNVPTVDQRLFQMIANENSECGSQMQEVMRQYVPAFDDNTIRGWNIALSNPNLFNYYWHDQEKQQAYFSHYEDEGFGFDLDNFIEIRRNFHKLILPSSNTKTTIIYGTQEKILDYKNETAFIQQHFLNSSVFEIENAAHYPHIEEAETVLAIIKNSIGSF